MDSVSRDNAAGILAWLDAVLASGRDTYGNRWSPNLSIMQAVGHLKPEDTSKAAEAIRHMDAAAEEVREALLADTTGDVRLDPLFEVDAMAGRSIFAHALFAKLEAPSLPAADLIDRAIGAVSHDLLGCDVRERP